jgi:hypothetical protein
VFLTDSILGGPEFQRISAIVYYCGVIQQPCIWNVLIVGYEARPGLLALWGSQNLSSLLIPPGVIMRCPFFNEMNMAGMES